MKKTKSHTVMKLKFFEQQFKLPNDFNNRISVLENELEKKLLSEAGLKELIDLYSSASSHYEAIGKINEFQNYFRKMQDIINHENVQPIIRRRESKELATHMINNFSNIIDNQKGEVIINELVKQEESFKQRLMKKKLSIKLTKAFSETIAENF